MLDALYDVREHMRLIVCRQEGGAAFMAEAYGKLTGRPGICFVTRGPGATNASIGVHTAYQDSTPMILFIGQVGGDVVEREAFQEVDYRRMFGQMAKWVAQIDRADRIPEYVSHAFHLAVSGRPGPVVLALPEDMLASQAVGGGRRALPAGEAASGRGGHGAVARHAGARRSRPLVILGRRRLVGARRATTFAPSSKQWNLPAACSFRRQDLLDNRHSELLRRGRHRHQSLSCRSACASADLILAIGPRLGEMTTSGYTLFAIPQSTAALRARASGRRGIGARLPGRVDDQCRHGGICRSGAASLPVSGLVPLARVDASRPRRTISKNLEAGADAGELDLGEVMAFLRDRLPEDAIITNGAGNLLGVGAALLSVHRFSHPAGPTNGAMGYGVPSAIAAKLVHPDRVVVSFSGDGCFLMNGQELATAVQYRLPVMFVVVNNGMYGTIRMHQEREYPARVYATALQQSGLRRAGTRLRIAWGDGGAAPRTSHRPSNVPWRRANRPFWNCASIRRPSPRARA